MIDGNTDDSTDDDNCKNDDNSQYGGQLRRIQKYNTVFQSLEWLLQFNLSMMKLKI